MKNSLHILIFCLLALTSWSQQDIQFSQTLSNPYIVNPAAGGMMGTGEIILGSRAQWLDVDGSPRTFFASVQSQIRWKGAKDKPVLEEFNTAGKSFYATPQRTIGKKHVLGGKMMNDQIGPFTKSSINGSYAIHLPFSSKLNVGIGLGLGWSNFGLDESKTILGQAGDNAYLSFVGGTAAQNFLDASAGLVAYNDRFYFGLSSTQIFNNTTRFDGVETANNYARHLYAVGSYRIDLSQIYSLEPLAIIKKTGNSPFSIDAGMRLHYQRLGWLSVSYRSQSALSIGFGMNVLKHFRLSYAYDLGLNKVTSFGAGGHEIQLGFLFGHRRNLNKEFKEDEKKLEKQEVIEEEAPKAY